MITHRCRCRDRADDDAIVFHQRFDEILTWRQSDRRYSKIYELLDASFYVVWILKKTGQFILIDNKYFEVAVVIDLDNLSTNGKWTI